MFGELPLPSVPVKMLYEELQRLVMRWRQLSQQILDFEQHPIELHADLACRNGARIESLGFKFFHDDALAFLRQTDEVVVVTEQDERLWKLESTRRIRNTKLDKKALFFVFF